MSTSNRSGSDDAIAKPHPFEVARAALVEAAETDHDPYWCESARRFAALIPSRAPIDETPENVIRADFRRAS